MVLEVICKTCCILYSSFKYLVLWEFLVCLYKIFPVGSIRWFWSSSEWLESDGRNFWFLMVHFFLLVSMLCFSELPVWALSLSDTNELPRSGVNWWIWCLNTIEWQSMSSGGSMLPGDGRKNGDFWGWMKSPLKEEWYARTSLDCDRKNSLDQMRSFDYIPVSVLHI